MFADSFYAKFTCSHDIMEIYGAVYSLEKFLLNIAQADETRCKNKKEEDMSENGGMLIPIYYSH